MTTTLLKRTIALMLVIFIAACSTTPKKEPTERELYEEAKKAIKLKNFQKATTALEDLEARFPFGKYAQQAQLDLVYARYSNLDLDGAILAADRFIRLHPQSPNVDYAYYIRGLSNYYIDSSLSSQYFPGIDVSSRDLGSMRQSFEDFSEVITRFPNSEYAADSRQRMVIIRNRLASYELHAARYYIRRQAFVAASNRAAYVLTHFPNTPSVEEALSMLTELYAHMGMEQESEEALALLKANFSSSSVFDEKGQYVSQYTFKQNRSFLNAISFGLLDRGGE